MPQTKAGLWIKTGGMLLSQRRKMFSDKFLQISRSAGPPPHCQLEPEIKHWDCKAGIIEETPQMPWVVKVADAWQKEGCMITVEVCRKKLKAIWHSTRSGRLNLLLWRIFSRKLPVREITNKWSTSYFCPRCHSKKESLKHALWDCQGIQPIWKKCSAMLESIGVTERIQWKQAVIGNKGRMNPAFYKVWQYIRAVVLSKVWQDRNQIAHHKPAMNLDGALAKDFIF